MLTGHLGNDPTRYRGSNEALVRRISQGKDLYRVNTVVDINNLLSLETLHSAGTFDLDRVQPPIIFRVGQPGEIYAGIGRGEIKIEGLPVFADQSGPFGSTTSDSERTMVRLDTTRILMVVISFLGAEGMDKFEHFRVCQYRPSIHPQPGRLTFLPLYLGSSGLRGSHFRGGTGTSSCQ